MKINLLNNGRVVNHYPITKKGIPSSVPIELETGENKIQILADTESNTLQSNIIKIYHNGTAKKLEPKLYVFSVGISKYKNITSLQYADEDAKNINKILKKQEGKPEDKPENKLWKEVVVKEEYTLLNERATKSEIIKQLAKFIQEPTENDVSILFFSGHGGSYANSYYLLPHDFDDSSSDKIVNTGIDINFLLAQISALKGKIILFVDACYSGNIKGDLTLLSKLPNEKKIAVFASSRSYQTSLEINGGLMVRAFQDIIASGDGVDRISKKITLASLEHPLRTQVKLLSKEKNQKPSILIPEDLEDLEIAIPKNL